MCMCVCFCMRQVREVLKAREALLLQSEFILEDKTAREDHFSKRRGGGGGGDGTLGQRV